MRSNVTLVGCNGLNDQTGISTSQINEARINRKIIQNSGQVIVFSRLHQTGGKSSNFTVGSIDDVDILITDSFADLSSLLNLKKWYSSHPGTDLAFSYIKQLGPYHDKSWCEAFIIVP